MFLHRLRQRVGNKWAAEAHAAGSLLVKTNAAGPLIVLTYYGFMNPKIPSKHGAIGMPSSGRRDELVMPTAEVKTIPQEQALAAAAMIAQRNQELMRRLA